MLNLDPRSIILMSGILALMMSLVLLVLRRSYPSSIKGLAEWAVGPLLCFMSTVALGTRGLIPDFVSVVIGNLLLMTGSAMYYFGSQRFFGLRPTYRFWGAVILCTAPLFMWFLYKEPNYGARLVVFTLVMISLFVTHSVMLFRIRPKHIFTLFTAGVLLLQAGFLLLRLGFVALDVGMRGVLDNSPFQTVYLSAFALCILLVSIGMVLMATERVRGEFENMATHDGLTGALTRRALIGYCEQELERCRRHGHTMALLMMDLDHFKKVNDTYGHLVGDHVLKDFASRVLQQLRLPDRMGRFGGEEFVLLLPNTSLEEAQSVAERIRGKPSADADIPSCTVSIGITTLHTDQEDIDDLIARADTALYRAKAHGRDRVETA